ncbi:MAG: Gfo/Idh/MocA family protein [Kiritimatiellia bacterium]
MNPISIGILGFAHGHVGMYCARWREYPAMGVRVVAGWDHDAARLSAAVGANGLEACASAEALVARPDIQAVLICAETSRHADLTELAAAAGKIVILQKPIALTLAEADRIVRAAQRVPLTLAWQMRVDPHNLQARDLLASGKFGRIFMIRRRHTLNTQDWPDFEKSWHVQPALNRDIFADDAAHPMDFIYWLRGLPESVTAEITTVLNPKIPNDNGIAVFRYAEGALAEVSCTFVARAGENTLEIVAEHGFIVGNYGDGPSAAERPAGLPQLKWWLKGDGWTSSVLPEVKSQGERICGLAAPLADFLHGRRPPIATAAEGRDVLRMALACLQSSAEGRRVRIAKTTTENKP